MCSEEKFGKDVSRSYLELEGNETEISEWFDDVVMGVQKKCKDANEATIDAEILKKMNKDVLCEWLEEVWGICDRIRNTSVLARKTLHNLKGQVITCQSQVIELQHSLLEKKSVELEAVTTAVTTTVKESVKSECIGYAEAVKKSYNPVLSSQTLTEVIKEVVQEEDRSRNLIVFGLDEDKEEQLSEKICDLFETMGEKPRTEAYRIGKLSAEKTSPRPVKVTMTSSSSVHQLLDKAKRLKTSSKYQKVFLSPDRSLSERASHRDLVKELKNRIADDPQKHHYIRNATVFSVGKVD